MSLVIVESPTKAKTLSKYLPKDKFSVTSSKGHVRDLPRKDLGVDVENNFEPQYVVPKKAKKTIKELQKLTKETKEVVLATDPDREGEAIAWHLKHLLKEKNKDLKFSRVFFHELTKDAVMDAFDHPAELNEDLVNAQQARRVLDRLVGYKLSPLLWKKVRYGLSAGRVQSVAVRLIVEKERERDAFDVEEYWTLDVDFLTTKKEQLTADLKKKDGKKVEISNEKDAEKIKKELEKDEFEVALVKKSQRKRKTPKPFKTSTLQRAASNVFGFTARRTMGIAQKLFEKGHITYHRTDSLNLAPAFVKSTRSHLKKELGEEYIPKKAKQFKTKSKGAQEAHEAVRPTDIKNTPEKLKLTKDEHKLYSLIWQRALECQSVPAVYDQTRVDIESKKGYMLRANGSIITFKGWLAVGEKLGIGSSTGELTELPEIKEGTSLEAKEVRTDQHFTQPPARYSDATLIKKLEELGIGRPSTYAPTISTIQRRKYIRKEGRYFIPEDVAYVVTDLLVEHFPSIVGYDFTAEMEDDLDAIAHEGKDWHKIIKEFYTPFEKTLEKKEKELNKRDVTTLEETDKTCPKCKKNKLVVKLGKYGKFLSCSGYPECDYAEPLEEDKVFDEDGKEITDFGECDKCDDGHFILKRGRYGKFLACSNYPDCKNTKPYLDKIGMKCPDCEDGEVVRKKAKGREFFGCSNYPDCEWSSWKNPLEEGAEGSEDGDEAKDS
ncbi:type I DNA topoisomerase [candidate division WWE3 bacterium]|nr:type I DNA topoisomerase [candidate division WWE3 bacterium]